MAYGWRIPRLTVGVEHSEDQRLLGPSSLGLARGGFLVGPCREQRVRLPKQLVNCFWRLRPKDQGGKGVKKGSGSSIWSSEMASQVLQGHAAACAACESGLRDHDAPHGRDAGAT